MEPTDDEAYNKETYNEETDWEEVYWEEIDWRWGLLTMEPTLKRCRN
jgi:hypothetical protein